MLPCAGHSIFQLTPVDLAEGMAEPVRHYGGTSLKSYLRKGKTHGAERGGEEKVRNSRGSTKVGEEGEEGRRCSLLLEQVFPCNLWKRPRGSRCSCCGLWRTHAEDFPEWLQPVGSALLHCLVGVGLGSLE